MLLQTLLVDTSIVSYSYQIATDKTVSQFVVPMLVSTVMTHLITINYIITTYVAYDIHNPQV